ncbi:MAG: pyridoxamine 5'-phosphate oxidase family protein [Candidatus Kaiserbacteria bacterium]|nr:pyridoxamine 5'-phosphate oxidase family protein [Candidatus Kaiserbacteria bacterium]MCB9816413.1 pyridoxamine 5'-phosphate oxidase family protein [Candidatus Nomurabacteria bacterium]
MNQAQLRQTIIDFLNQHRKAVFSILDEKGLPTTSLMLYVIDDELNVFFGTRKAFSKYQHIIDNPVVSLSVIEEVVDPLKVVDIRGDVTQLSPEDQEKVHSFFKEKNPAKYYVEGAEDFVMFKLTPHFVRWLDAASGELSIVDLSEIR